MAPAPLDLHCPQCGRDDMVRKVSAIVSGETAIVNNTSRVSGAGPVIGGNGGVAVVSGTNNTTTVTQTMLSQRLQAPTMLQYGWPGETLFKTNPNVVRIGLGIVNIIIFIGDNPVYVKFGFLFFAICVWYLYEKRYVKLWTEWTNIGLPNYQTALNQWNRNYYCGRCDRVFTPRPLSQLEPAASQGEFRKKQFYKKTKQA